MSPLFDLPFGAIEGVGPLATPPSKGGAVAAKESNRLEPGAATLFFLVKKNLKLALTFDTWLKMQNFENFAIATPLFCIRKPIYFFDMDHSKKSFFLAFLVEMPSRRTRVYSR